MSESIKFGTDGWRAIIAKDFTVGNVARVATATAMWMNTKTDNPSLVLGFDCRFGGAMFAEVIIKVMAAQKVKVYYDRSFVSTPMISLAAKKLNCHTGVIITASHNPPSYNGYKLKSGFGGPAIPAAIAEVESMIPDKAEVPEYGLDEIENDGLLVYRNFEDMYLEEVNSKFDLEKIRNSGLKLAYDAMYGAGMRILKRIIPQAVMLHDDYNPSFKGQAPEPLHKNLLELSETIRNDDEINVGLATDGDADRIGMYDEHGNFVDAHHIILLLIHILHIHKKMSGKVVIAFSVSNKVKKLCEAYGLDYQVTKIGFKYICEIMLKEDVLVGGEESGGIAVKGHIPERDGIWDGLVILDYLATTGKKLSEVIREVYEVVGPFSYLRNDLHITEVLKRNIIENCRQRKYGNFGGFKVQQVEDIDGFKFYLGDRGETVMIRPSGTEPVLRIYAEGPDSHTVQRILDETEATLLN